MSYNYAPPGHSYIYQAQGGEGPPLLPVAKTCLWRVGEGLLLGHLQRGFERDNTLETASPSKVQVTHPLANKGSTHAHPVRVHKRATVDDIHPALPRTLNYGNCGIVLIMRRAGFRSSAASKQNGHADQTSYTSSLDPWGGERKAAESWFEVALVGIRQDRTPCGIEHHSLPSVNLQVTELSLSLTLSAVASRGSSSARQRVRAD